MQCTIYEDVCFTLFFLCYSIFLEVLCNLFTHNIQGRFFGAREVAPENVVKTDQK